MKRYWVLAWYQYYPYSSLRNVYETFLTLDEAREYAAKLEEQGAYDCIEVKDVSYLLGVEEEIE